jgi:hypothetical protein
MLRRIFGPKREEDGSWENYIMKNFTACILHRILLGCSNQGDEVGGTCSTHGEGRGVYRVLVGGPKVRDHWEDLGVGGRMTLSWTLGR